MKTLAFAVAGIAVGALGYALLTFGEGAWADLFAGGPLLDSLPRILVTLAAMFGLFMLGFLLPPAATIGVLIGMLASVLVGIGLVLGNPNPFTTGDPFYLYLLSRGPQSWFVWISFGVVAIALVGRLAVGPLPRVESRESR